MSDNETTESNEKKPKSKRIRTILIVIIAIVACFCILLAIGLYQSSTPEGQLTSTSRAETNLETQEAETELAVIEETEAAKPAKKINPYLLRFFFW